MIHLRDLPSLSSLKAWMHSGATETLRSVVSCVAVNYRVPGNRTRMMPEGSQVSKHVARFALTRLHTMVE